jgi:hypothetical protein
MNWSGVAGSIEAENVATAILSGNSIGQVNSS